MKHEPAFIEPFVGQTAGWHQVRAVRLDIAHDAGRQLRLAGALGPAPGGPPLGISVVWDSVAATSTQRVSNPR